MKTLNRTLLWREVREASWACLTFCSPQKKVAQEILSAGSGEEGLGEIHITPGVIVGPRNNLCSKVEISQSNSALITVVNPERESLAGLDSVPNVSRLCFRLPMEPAAYLRCETAEF